VFHKLIAGLYLAMTPVALQAQLASAAKVSSDIRIVQRQTTDAAALQMQPPPGMVFIPGGQVFVGTDIAHATEYGQNDPAQVTTVLAETPRHTTTVDAFFIDTTEVTNLQWKLFLDATGRKPSTTLVQWNWPDGQIPEGQEDFPISNINVPEIREYLEWCGKRLPTEDEWVRAARGDDDRLYPWGGKWDSKLCQSGMSVPQAPVKVGSFPGGASPYGVLDMAGNVFEWVDSPFAAFPDFEPLPWKQGRKAITLAPEFNNTEKVIKGGCFVTTRHLSRIDARDGQQSDSSDQGLGFRCARSLQPGLEAVRHGKRRLLPPQFARIGLDEKDIFGKEITYYDDARKVITGYRFLALAHRASDRGKTLATVRKESVDEPFPLGVLVSSEPLIMPNMKDPATKKPLAIPAGEYTLCYKGPGESAAWKARQKADRERGDEDESAKNDDDKGKSKSGKGKAGKEKDKDEPAASDEEPAPPGDVDLGAAVPWPGVGSIHDITEDIDFPQDEEVFLFINAANAVVAWQKTGHVAELDDAIIEATPEEGGRVWTVVFSINQLTTKTPRFTLPLHLAGEGLPP